MSLPSPYTDADARSWLATLEPGRRAGTALEMALADTRTDTALGSLGVRFNTQTLSTNIGYWLAPDAQGRGHVTSAVRLLCTWLFEELHIGRIELTTAPQTTPS